MVKLKRLMKRVLVLMLIVFDLSSLQRANKVAKVVVKVVVTLWIQTRTKVSPRIIKRIPV
jgi:hypothetical protein